MGRLVELVALAVALVVTPCVVVPGFVSVGVTVEVSELLSVLVEVVLLLEAVVAVVVLLLAPTGGEVPPPVE